jgi:hypothetical protein
VTQTAIGTGVAGAVLGGIVGYFVRRLLDARQIRYRHLYERRAEVITALHTRLVELGLVLQVWGEPFGGFQEEQQEAYRRRFNELFHYFWTNSLWLDNQTRTALINFLQQARKVYRLISELEEFSSPEEWEDYQSGRETPMTRADARSEIQRLRTDEIPNLEEQLREDFREIIEISDLRDRDAPPSWGMRVWMRVTSFFRGLTSRSQQPEDGGTSGQDRNSHSTGPNA